MRKYFFCFCFIFLLTAVWSSCDQTENEGQQLVKQYCGSCHLPVMPDALDKQTWLAEVLPAMAPRLGIKVFGKDQYVNDPFDSTAAISFKNWSKIVSYYEKYAPLKLDSAVKPEPIAADWSIFKLKLPAAVDSSIANTVMVSIDPSTGLIYSSDGFTRKLKRWNRSLETIDSVLLPSAAVHVLFNKKENDPASAIFTSMGTMVAKDISEGTLLEFNLDKNLEQLPDTIAKNLPRPVCSQTADFNRDGLNDLVVGGFGHNMGGLSVYEQTAGKQYRKKSILEIPGAIQITTGDYNNDGWTDLMVLFAHAEESIRIFYNDQKGAFTSKILMQFSPVAGSSSFQLADFNKDGLPDILYSSGDNSDLSRILKPFHGIYIFINDGDFKFTKRYFYPVNGCMKAMAADFDKDGDLDIASIAFHADYKNNAAEKFIYFEQDKPIHFIPHSPSIQNYGRWLCMDVNDYDRDGDLDIVLGNFSGGFLNESSFKRNWDRHLPFILLENINR